MNKHIEEMARSITRESSKQTYYTILLLVDKDLVNDCFCAYAYFRWVDDVIDISSETLEDRVSFMSRQRALIERLYDNDRPNGLALEEQFIAHLISHDRGENNRLRSFIFNFLAILEFDAHRKKQSIYQYELDWYSSCLARSVTDGIQYFICNCYPYPESDFRYLAANGAHVTHMLRDMVDDISEGYVNIPQEYLEENNVEKWDVENPVIRAWVRDRVALARRYFLDGKRYLDDLEVLRCKIAGYWYCARFEVILNTIENDNFILRNEYNGWRKLSRWVRMAWLGFTIAFEHITQQAAGGSWRRPVIRI
jgi:phytoene/squalene synthetase